MRELLNTCQADGALPVHPPAASPMLAVRLTVPVFIEITTPTPDPEAALLRARAFLREQLQRIAAVDGSAWMDRELGDVVRAWTV